MAKKAKLIQVGITPDGVPVVDGVFKLVDTYGIPLDIILSGLKKSNMLCCWTSFFESSVKAGWKAKSTLVKIETAVGDVYGRDTIEPIMDRLKLTIVR